MCDSSYQRPFGAHRYFEVTPRMSGCTAPLWVRDYRVRVRVRDYTVRVRARDYTVRVRARYYGYVRG